VQTTTHHVRQAVAGNDASLAWVLERLTPFVEAHIRFRIGGRGNAHDVEDLVADTWAVTLERLGDLRPREERLTPVLLAFLGRTALFNANNFLRRALIGNHGNATGSPRLSNLAERTRSTLGDVVDRELTVLLRTCLARLARDKREVLVLRLLEGKTNQEIAAVLGIPANTVAVRYRRAIEELRAKVPVGLMRELRPGRNVAE
jgi:RNA polymerase sigma factor (sigma-70 family)